MDTFDQIGGAGEGRHRTEPPRYLEIAQDVAAKIVEGVYSEGEKIYARSALASQYGVSSETARRAVCILVDLGIVTTSRGSGVIIASRDKAVTFVRQQHGFISINDLHLQLMEAIQRQQEGNRQINELLEKLVKKTERFRTSNPFVPYRIQLLPNSPHVEKTLQDLNFWHTTQATVVAIEHDEKLLLSPGPYVTLKAGDILYYLGNADCVDKVEHLFSPEPPET